MAILSRKAEQLLRLVEVATHPDPKVVANIIARYGQLLDQLGDDIPAPAQIDELVAEWLTMRTDFVQQFGEDGGIDLVDRIVQALIALDLARA